MVAENVDAIATSEKVGARAWGILAVTYLCSLCAPLCQFKIPPVASWLFMGFAQEGLDAVSFGLLMSALSIIGVILAFPAAFIARRIGLKNVILISVACLGIGSLASALAPTLLLLMASRMLEGIGIGLIGVAAPSCITIWFPVNKRGLALGIWATWVPAGFVVAFLISPVLAMSGGYQLPFIVIAIVCLIAFVLFAIVYKMPEGAKGDMGVEGRFRDSFSYLKSRRIWILGLVFFLFAVTTIGIMNTYYNTFLETELGYDPATASALTAIVMFISLIVAPLTGFVSDRLPIGRKYIVGIVMMALLLVSGFIMFYTGEAAVAVMWVVIFLQGIGAGMCGGSLRPMAPLLVRNTAMGATMSMAVMQFCQNLGSSIGSPIFGWAMQTWGWDVASWAIQVPCYAAALVLCFFILPRGKNVTQMDGVPAEEAWPPGY